MLKKSNESGATAQKIDQFIGFDARVPAFTLKNEQFDVIENAVVTAARYEYRAREGSDWTAVDPEKYYGLSAKVKKNIEASVTMTFADGKIARLTFNLGSRLGATIAGGLFEMAVGQPVTLKCGAMAKGTAFAGADGKDVVLEADIVWASLYQNGEKIRISVPDTRKVTARDRDDYAVAAIAGLAKKLGSNSPDPLDAIS